MEEPSPTFENYNPSFTNFVTKFCKALPFLKGAILEILDGPGIHQGRRGGLEIVYNQQHAS
ncbi:hypothetical protein FRX31_034420, partial [Thalictrum thalictroides]